MYGSKNAGAYFTPHLSSGGGSSKMACPFTWFLTSLVKFSNLFFFLSRTRISNVVTILTRNILVRGDFFTCNVYVKLLRLPPKVCMNFKKSDHDDDEMVLMLREMC